MALTISAHVQCDYAAKFETNRERNATRVRMERHNFEVSQSAFSLPRALRYLSDLTACCQLLSALSAMPACCQRITILNVQATRQGRFRGKLCGILYIDLTAVLSARCQRIKILGNRFKGKHRIFPGCLTRGGRAREGTLDATGVTLGVGIGATE